MIDKENAPLSRCQIEFPELPGIKFMGCFKITNKDMAIWIEFEKSNNDSKILFSYLNTSTNFTILISSYNRNYSCFRCLCLEDLNFISPLDFGLIEIFCSSWIEAIHADSEEIKIVTKAYTEFPFLEFWFRGVNEAYFITDACNIRCFNREVPCYDIYHCTTTKKHKCYFELDFQEKKTLHEIARTEESIWLFIRFATNIPIPRGIINIPDDDNPNRSYLYNFSSGHCPVITNYAKPTEYTNMPIYLKDITENKDVFLKWDAFLSGHYHAVKMWTKEMRKESFFDEKIAHYVQIFDSLTNDIKNKSLKDRLQYCFDKYSIYMSEGIKEDTAENLKEIRVAFSHLKDSSFIHDRSINGETYMQYEKIIQRLIRVIITEIVFGEEMLKRLINTKLKA